MRTRKTVFCEELPLQNMEVPYGLSLLVIESVDSR